MNLIFTAGGVICIYLVLCECGGVIPQKRDSPQMEQDTYTHIAERLCAAWNEGTAEEHLGDLDQFPVGVVVCEGEGEIAIAYANLPFARMAGYSSVEPLIQTSLGALFHAQEDRLRFMNAIEGKQEIRSMECRITGDHNTPVWVSLGWRRSAGHIICTARDITRKVRTEEKNRAIRKKLRTAKRAAEESFRQKSAFLDQMSQEIKSPLNAITGFAELLADPETTGELKEEYAGYLHTHTRRLKGMIHQMLELARLEASEIKPRPDSCRIGALLHRIRDEFIREKGIESEQQSGSIAYTSGDDPGPAIMTDPEMLRQLMMHLLDNAWTHGKPPVELGYRLKGRLAEIRVIDHGPGMDPDCLEMAPERFWRSPEAQASGTPGLGLGLTISTYLVKAMKGEIRMESTSRDGTTVCVKLPATPASTGQLSGDLLVPDQQAVPLGNRKILVAEDNPLNYMLVKAYLQSEGVELTWAKDGAEAVDHCRGVNGFDLVLMDIQMPRMDGYLATREIRQLRPSLPVIAVTACQVDTSPESAAEAGFSEILTKPISQETLISSLMRHLQTTDIPMSNPEPDP